MSTCTMKLYWNRLLVRWMTHEGSASPYFDNEEAFDKPRPFGITTERFSSDT